MDEHNDVISLQDYLTVLRRQGWLIAAVVALTVAAAVAVSLAQTPLYESQAEVAVEPIRRTGDVSLEQLLQPQSSVVETERLVVTSRPVTTRAAETIGVTDLRGLLQQISVEIVRDTRVVRIVATDPDPVVAASMADAFAEGYLDYRRDQAVDQLLAAAANLEDRAAGLEGQITEIDAQLAGGEADEALNVQRDALLAQLGQVLGQASELDNATENVSGGGEILTPAEVADEPVSPQPVRTGALALVLGLLLGVGLAFLRDHVDDVIRDESDFRRVTGGRSILGRIPNWKDPDSANRLATVVEPTSGASESYRELSAGVRFLLLAHQEELPAEGQDPLGHSILVTSATAGDGKTSTAANLAVSAARVGLRTLLVDADLRRPTVATRFGLGRTTGVSDVLLNGDHFRDHVVDVGIPELLVLPAGTLPPNPNELLASPAMRALERDLLKHADIVIYDSPAVLAVSDALELGRHVDLAVIVARAGVTGRRQLGSAIERLDQVGTDVAGTVLNDINAKDDGYYYSYYGYPQDGQAHGDADAPVPKRKSRRARRAAQRRGAQSLGVSLDVSRDEGSNGSGRSTERAAGARETDVPLFGARDD